MKKPQQKRFIVRKYVMAYSAMEALKKENRYKADDVWLDEDYMKTISTSNGSTAGFQINKK